MERQTLRFLGREYPFEPGDSVLDCLKANGRTVASSCYAGTCGACVLRAVDGTVSERARARLHSGARAFGEFLSCICPARADLCVEPVDYVRSYAGRVHLVERLDEDMILAHVRPEGSMEHRPGQVIHLVRPSDGLSRPSIVTSTLDDPLLELYMHEPEGGDLGSWLLGAQEKDVVVEGPSGHFFYMNDLDEPLVLIGIGAAFAPVLGVFRAAIRGGHRAPVTFLRVRRNVDDRLRKCLERGAVGAPCQVTYHEELGEPGDAETIERALRVLPSSLYRTRVYLAGTPLLLRKFRMRVVGLSADPDRVHLAPFKPTPATQVGRRARWGEQGLRRA